MFWHVSHKLVVIVSPAREKAAWVNDGSEAEVFPVVGRHTDLLNPAAPAVVPE
jgi:hypothetical protein